MYLKNTSDSLVIMKTKQGPQYINPGEVISILERDVIVIHSSLKLVSEEEYEQTVKETNKLKLDKKETPKQKTNDEVEVKENEPETKQVSEQTGSTEKRQNKSKMSQEEIEGRLNELKKAWEQAETVKQKETYAKEIKELNKKLKG